MRDPGKNDQAFVFLDADKPVIDTHKARPMQYPHNFHFIDIGMVLELKSGLGYVDASR